MLSIFQDMRITNRLRLGFGILLALLVGIIAINDVVSTNNRERMNAMLASSRAKVELTNQLKAAQLESVVAIRSIGLQSDVAAMNREEEKIKTQTRVFTDARNKLMALGVSGEGRKIFAEFDRLGAELAKPTADAITASLGFNQEAAARIIATRVDPLYLQVLGELNKLVALHKAEEQAAIDDSAASARRLKWVLISIGAVAVVLGMAMAGMITRSITEPLDSAVCVAKRVAEGDLSSHIEVGARDETGQLMEALANMNGNLMKVVHEVRAGTDTISSASSQIASGNRDLAQRTEEHADGLRSAVASMEELTGAVRKNTESASSANNLALSASSVAARGGADVARAVETMAEINSSAREIVDIISVIEGIAFQTNILALNAAVEAARAGEQGRGFAVVASEVRNLAQRSAAAAKEIKSLIEDSVGKIATGNKLVSQAGATMNDIVTSVKKVTEIMSEITEASQSQSSDIARINQTLAHIDEGTRQNATLVEEAAASAASLEEMASNLERVVSVFNLGAVHHLPAARIRPTLAAVPSSGSAGARRRLTSV